MHEKRAAERSIVARHNKLKRLHVSSSLVEKRRGQRKHALRRSIRGYNNSKCAQLTNTPTFNKFSLSQQMSMRYLMCCAALKNQCKQAKGVGAAQRCKSTASWLRISYSVGWNVIRSRVLDSLISRDWMWNWELLKFASLTVCTCTDGALAHWLRVAEKGAISTQMHLIASTLSRLAAELWTDQMLLPGPAAPAGAWGQVDAASRNRKCSDRLGGCFGLCLLFLCSFDWSVSKLWCFASAAGAVQ